jgi:hypothetical protein
VKQPQFGVVEVVCGHASGRVFGVVHRVGDELADVIVLQPENTWVPSRLVRTNRAIRSFARCCDTDGPGLPTVRRVR